MLRKTHDCNKPPSTLTYILIEVFGVTGLGSCFLFAFLRRKFGICKDCESGTSGHHSSQHSPMHNYGSSERRGSKDSVSSASSGGGGGDF